MGNSKYVWMVHIFSGRNNETFRDYFHNEVFRFPFQVRKFARQYGFSIFDEMSSDEGDLIIFNKEYDYKNWKGLYVNKVKIV